ncbi:MAG: flagellar hook-associated protein FlgK [Campylobacterales bacterium]
MASIFNSLYVGYSGLNASQIGIDTTGHNISNAETEGYTRQRTIAVAASPLAINPSGVGNGVDVQSIERVYDDFVFTRYTDISSSKEYSAYETDTLETLSTYFPEIDGVGIKNDLTNYYDSWQTLADNPDNTAVKTDLESKAESLTKNISYTKQQVVDLQSQVNEELAVDVNEVNRLAKELAQINKSIDAVEAGGTKGADKANDLRDRRNVIEKDLSRLIGAKRTTDQLKSNIQIDRNSNDITGSYTIQVNGFNIVDGGTYHPIHMEKDKNQYGFYELSYERQDGTLIPMSEDISGGRVGAMLDLRGHNIDRTSGVPTDGILQNVIAELDSFANGLIQTTNNLYAQSASDRFDSNTLDIDEDTPLINSTNNINTGSFNVVVYDIDGNEVATREINIDYATSMSDSDSGNSIKDQIEANKDDNDDNDANNDIDDYINFDFGGAGTSAVFSIDPQKKADGYTFAIVDNLEDDKFGSGTNFAGGFGFGRFFDGDNASNIRVNSELARDPDKISAGDSPSDGDDSVALDMVQQQYEEYKFNVGDSEYKETLYGMFDVVATDVGSKTNAALIREDTVSAQFSAVEMEYFSVSKVNTDEEMTNLIKYQTAYGAAAKIITTIDQMMDTLLGIKK